MVVRPLSLYSATLITLALYHTLNTSAGKMDVYTELFEILFYSELNANDYTGSVLMASENGTMSMINNCTCEGHVQIYECSVIGYGATIWRGSALDCSSSTNEIVILRSDSVNRSITCNNGEIYIVGHLVRRENNSYVSQLSVSVSSEVIGRNISCYHEVGIDTIEIGTSQLEISAGTLSYMHLCIVVISNSS